MALGTQVREAIFVEGIVAEIIGDDVRLDSGKTSIPVKRRCFRTDRFMPLGVEIICPVISSLVAL